MDTLESCWARLRVHLGWADRFWLVFVFTDDRRVGDELATRTDALLHDRILTRLDPTRPEDLIDGVPRLFEGPDDSVAWIDGVRFDQGGEPGWQAAWTGFLLRLNERRERLRRARPRGGMVFVAPRSWLGPTGRVAPDLWTVRWMVFEVAAMAPVGQAQAPGSAWRGAAAETRTGSAVAVELARAAVRRAETQAGRASALSRLAEALGDVGALEPALMRHREAEAQWRALAEEHPDAYLPHLAKALDTLGVRLGTLGRPDEGVTATEEAVAIRRSLARSRPADHLADLAASLNRLGVQRSRLGLLEEALTAVQESVHLRRTLAQAQPDTGRAPLAGGLTSLGSRLWRLGRLEEALVASEEAVRIYRTLAQARPGDHLPDLARSLNNLGADLSGLGRLEEALAATGEAVEIYRALIDARTDAYLPDLAMCLDNLSAYLSTAGRLEQAVVASTASVDAYLSLIRRDPGALSERAERAARHHHSLCQRVGQPPAPTWHTLCADLGLDLAEP